MKKLFKKIWCWFDDRTGISETVMPLLKHPAPPKKLWSYVFGSATLFVFILQVITGVALSLLYQPSSNNAYQSLEFITNKAKFGNVSQGHSLLRRISNDHISRFAHDADLYHCFV